MDLPERGQKWRHHRGAIYTIECVANKRAVNDERFPVTVVYTDNDGATWARKASDFLLKFTPAPYGTSTRARRRPEDDEAHEAPDQDAP
jgi:hypothetical protein